MDQINIITAEVIQKGIIAGAKSVAKNKDYINELNVFPVPDGDTGTNMSMTAQSAADSAANVTTLSISEVCNAIAQGALRGARGNSGVILSQILKGFTKHIADLSKITIPELSIACEKAAETGFKAVMKPKEGTILTVSQAIANEASNLTEETDVVTYLRKLIAAGQIALDNTPNQLPVLKEAGVVDSGGQGLICLLQGVYSYLSGEEIIADVPKVERKPIKTQISTDTIEFKYCTEFIVKLAKPKKLDAHVEELKAYLSTIGNSLVVVGDEDIIKIHVHTNHPGLAFEKGCSIGNLSSMKIDNMEEEHNETLEMKVEETTPVKDTPMEEVGIITIASGDGIVNLFKDLNINEIIVGGQTMNPSTEDIMSAIDKVNAKNVFILPNNKNIILTANQAAENITDKNIIVIPTTTILEGITCAINYSPVMEVEALEEIFRDVLPTVTSLEITTATRNVVLNGVNIKENDYIGISEPGIITSNKKLKTTVMKSIELILEKKDDVSIVTLYSGERIDGATNESIQTDLEKKYPEIEFDIYEGKQPVYQYLISLE